MLPEHDVYVTDWRDARVVPLVCGGFDLDDFIDYVVDFIRIIGPDTHVIAVCQTSVQVRDAVAAMAAADDRLKPALTGRGPWRGRGGSEVAIAVGGSSIQKKTIPSTN